MLTYKHTQSRQEVQVKENSQGAGVYENSPSWILITPELIEELNIEDTVRIDNGIYSGLTKNQIKDILKERNIKFMSHDKISDLIKRLKDNDIVKKKQIKTVELNIKFNDNLI